jgi:surface protein
MGFARRFFQSTIKQQRPFIATWKTDNTSSGSSNSDQVKLPLINTGIYNFIVDWGDNTTDLITTWNQAETTHTYASSGTYIIKITGLCSGWSFSNTGDRQKITDISQWGDLRFTQINNIANGVFFGCTNLNISATDAPDFSGITQLDAFLRGCTNFNSEVNHWDVSGFTSLRYWFQGTSFNKSLSNWDVSNVNLFDRMFENSPFNQNINNWDVSSATDIRAMFRLTTFNQPLDNWDVSGVSLFGGVNAGVFQSNTAFNQNIGGWDVSSATNMGSMFNGATAFNQSLNLWNVSGVTNMASMFLNASSFNENITSWNTGNVTNMSTMFQGCDVFNQNIGGWDVSKVTSMSNMLRSCNVFNQDIGSWNVGLVVNMSNIFNGSPAFNQNIGGWNVSNVTNFSAFMITKTPSTFNSSNLDSIYNGWSLLSVQPNIVISFGSAKYTAAGQAGRDILTGAPNNWTITDGGT